jgi:hypothetical protein
MAVVNFNRSIPELLTDIVNNFTALVRKETQLARVEMAEKIGDLAVGVGLLVGGSVLLDPGTGHSAASGCGWIGGGRYRLGLGGVDRRRSRAADRLILVGFGINRLKAARPIPTRTIEQLQRDAEVAKAQMRSEDDGTAQRAA